MSVHRYLHAMTPTVYRRLVFLSVSTEMKQPRVMIGSDRVKDGASNTYQRRPQALAP